MPIWQPIFEWMQMPLKLHVDGICLFWQGWFCAMAGWACIDLGWWLAAKIIARRRKQKKVRRARSSRK